MSWQNVKLTLPKVAASAIGMYVVVANDQTTDGQVIPAGSAGQDAVGVSLASVPTYGYGIPVAVEGVVKVLVAASIGAGARAKVASTNGAIGPVVGSGLATALGSALGAAGAVYSIGWVHEARAAGEYASLFIDPREVI